MQFIDLKSQYSRLEGAIRSRVDRVFAHGQYIMGPEIAELETALARYVGVKHCLSCSSGTDALLLALMAWGIGPGDAVFTTPFTFIATAEVIALVGATPVFVDIDSATWNIDPSKLDAAIAAVKSGQPPSPGAPTGLRPRAIIPVDIFGLCADYGAIALTAQKHGLLVLEDACQSFGASFRGRKACSLGDAAATSFFPAKPLGCYGDGGAVFTDSDELATILRSLRVHGQGIDKYHNERIGINGRMDTLQAAILLAKLEIFDEEMRLRQQVAARYASLLTGRVTLQRIPDDCVSAWAQFSVLSNDREAVLKRLAYAKIPAAIYYPIPLHLQTAFGALSYAHGSLPVSESIAGKILSLPMHPYLNAQEQELIASCINAG